MVKNGTWFHKGFVFYHLCYTRTAHEFQKTVQVGWREEEEERLGLIDEEDERLVEITSYVIELNKL